MRLLHAVPQRLNIPANFDLFNYANAYDDVDSARFRFGFMLKEGERAGACIDCDTCENLCPQHIVISDWMPKVSALLGLISDGCVESCRANEDKESGGMGPLSGKAPTSYLQRHSKQFTALCQTPSKRPDCSRWVCAK